MADQSHFNLSSSLPAVSQDTGPLDQYKSQETFSDKVSNFVEREKDVLSHLYSINIKENDKENDKKEEQKMKEKTRSSSPPLGLHGTPPPLEYHMMIDKEYRIQRVLQLMIPGVILEGFVCKVNSFGLSVELNTFHRGEEAVAVANRELIDLRIKGLVKLENLASDHSKCKSALKDYQIDDVIRGVVIGVEDKIVQLSFVSDNIKEVKLGYIDKELPGSTRLPNPNDYITSLTSSTGFRNPFCINNLKQVLGITSCTSIPPTASSLLRPILMTSIKEEECFESLKKEQRLRWSMDMVATGVTFFKIYRYSDAMKYFDYALEIDGGNAEAMVARGALYANKRQYEKAITDLESALTLNHTHANAKKYLVETQTAYGKHLEEQGDMKGALRCYLEALADSPTSEPAKTRADHLTSILEKQAAEKREKEKKKADEEKRLKKLQKIIDREHHNKKRKKKSKKRRRHSSNSSPHSSSDSSPSSSSSSRSSKRHKYK